MSKSAFRNAVRRREHYERHQPAARARFGLLEKKKDYVQRARNFHEKEKRLLALKRKAANKNEDEFYNKMNSAKTKDGIHEIDGRKELSPDVILMMKTQDKAYINTVLSTEGKNIEKLQSSLHLLPSEAGKLNSHVTFSVDEDEDNGYDVYAKKKKMLQLDMESEEEMDRDDDDEQTAFEVNESKVLQDLGISLSDDEVDDKDEKKLAKKNYKAKVRTLKELEERLKRSQKLERARSELDLEKAMQSKGRRTLVSKGDKNTPAVYKWQTKRLK